VQSEGYERVTWLGTSPSFVSEKSLKTFLAARFRLLLQDLSGVRMNLLVFDLARIPPATESLDQIYGAHQLLTQ
jgi:hypothetical protein